jgi:hypothetical protein
VVSVRTFVVPQAPPSLERGLAPTFAVVTATYQAAATIAEAIESALTQTMPPHEVIVVDDGSTDGTSDVLRPYLNRITYIRQENRGKPAALNVAMLRASADFLSILDADDLYEPERLEALTDLAMARPDLDLLMTDLYLEIDGKIVGRFCDGTPFPVADQRLAIFEDCFLAEPAVRREALIAVGGTDESLRIAHDWECWIRMLHAGSLAGCVDEPLVRYRIGGPSLTANRVEALRERVAVLERASRLDLSKAERDTVEQFLVRRRRRVVLAEAEQALQHRAPNARRRALAVALGTGMPPLVRIEALAAMLAPKAAARRLERRQATRAVAP